MAIGWDPAPWGVHIGRAGTPKGASGLWGPYAWEFGVRGGFLAWHLIHRQYKDTRCWWYLHNLPCRHRLRTRRRV